MSDLALAFQVTGTDTSGSKVLDRVGDSAQRAGEKTEKGSAKASKSVRLLFDTFASSSSGALGPLQEVVDKLDVLDRAEETGSSKVGGKLLGIGLAATAAGSFLESLQSKEQGALQQLQASIATTGQEYEPYAEKVEKAVTAGEHFGQQASTTIDALNRLVTTTHNPAEAFRDLSVAEDVVAEKHISLAKASEIVGLTFNGSTRAGKQFGLQLENTTGAVKALGVAQKASVSSTTAVQSAQKSYNEKLDEYRQTLQPTLAQAYGLKNAHDKLVEAEKRHADATKKLHDAQLKANDATGAGARNVAKLAAVVRGQASSSADTFTGHLRALGAQVEDTAGKYGKDFGGALVTVGPALAGVGAVIQSGILPKLGTLIGRLPKVGKAFTDLRDVEVATSAEGAAAIELNAAKGAEAVAGEAIAIEGSAGKIGLALKGIGAGIGSLALLGVGAFPDQGSVLTPNGKGLSSQEVKDFYSHPLSGLDSNTLKDLLAVAQKGGTIGAFNAPKDLAAQIADLLKQRSTPTPNSPQSSLSTQQRTQLNNDLNSDDPKVSARAHARLTAAAAADAAAAKAAAKKSGGDAGTASLDAFLKSIGVQGPVTQAMKADQASAKKAATDAAQAVVNAISTKFQAAKSKLAADLQASLDFRNQIKGALEQGNQITDLFAGPDLNANGAFGKQNNYGRLKALLAERVKHLRLFVLELRELLRRGVSQDVVAQIAQAGVDGGQRVAEAILSGGPAGVKQINSLTAQIDHLSSTGASDLAKKRFDAQIAADRKNTDRLEAQLARANASLTAIKNGRGGTASSQRATSAAIGS